MIRRSHIVRILHPLRVEWYRMTVEAVPGREFWAVKHIKTKH